MGGPSRFQVWVFCRQTLEVLTFRAFQVVLPFVPEGQLRIAQPFRAGKAAEHNVRSPGGTIEVFPCLSIVPPGLKVRMGRSLSQP